MCILRLLVLLFLSFCVACDDGVPQGKLLDTGLTKVQSLDVFAEENTLHLLVAGQMTDSSIETHYLFSEDGGIHWSVPVRADDGIPPPHKPARNTDVQIAASHSRLVAAWQVAGYGWGGYGPMITVISDDGGINWRRGSNPAGDLVANEQGFIDLDADDKENFHIVWLDTRNEQRGLRYARSENFGENWTDDRTIDDHTCECCWNRIKSSSDLLFVSYRDINPRDMHIAVSEFPGVDWSKNTNVGNFNWEFDGCPHTGGGLAIGTKKNKSEGIHTTSWTGETNIAGLYYSRSMDDGQSWQQPLLIGSSVAAKHSDVAVRDKEVNIVWSDLSLPSPGIVLARSTSLGEQFHEPVALDCDDHTTGSHPKIVQASTGSVVLWTTAENRLCQFIMK